jgi:hypothetical protein
MGGTIDIDSSGVAGEGSAFRLRLPLALEMPAASAGDDTFAEVLLPTTASLREASDS